MYKKPYRRGSKEHRHVYLPPLCLNPADFKSLYGLYEKVWNSADKDELLRGREEQYELESKTKMVSSSSFFLPFLK